MSRASARGFTLIEVMVAALIGAISIAVAAKVAQVVIKQSASTRERTDFHSRARTFTRQLRADLRVAGLGSTGSIAYDGGAGGFLGTITGYITPNGYPAIPAIAGADNIGAIGVGGLTTAAGTDAIMIIVPDPSTAVESSDFGRAPGSVIPMAGPAIGACGTAGSLIYITDATNPTGMGRAQVAWVSAWTPLNLTILGTLMFTAAPGSQIMCARISTYWVDGNGWLYRTDIDNVADGATAIAPNVWINNTAAVTDAISPGVVDLQIAYGMSAEFLRDNGQPLDPATRFANAGVFGIPTAMEWAEVRTVRFNMLTRTLRRIEEPGQVHTIVPRENGAVPAVPIATAHQVEWITSTEVLMNLRFFDEITTPAMDPDPY